MRITDDINDKLNVSKSTAVGTWTSTIYNQDSESYLKNRIFNANNIQDTKSTEREITAGRKPGSVLGPLHQDLHSEP